MSSGAEKMPTLIDLVRELRRNLGMFDGAMPCTPKAAWDDAIREVQRLTLAARESRCWACEERERWAGASRE